MKKNTESDRYIGAKFKSEKKGALAKRRLLLAAPFILFAAGVCLISLFVYQTMIKVSPYWSLMVSTAGVTAEESGERDEIDDEISEISVTVLYSDSSEGSEASEETSEPEESEEEPKVDILKTLPEIPAGAYCDIGRFPGISWGKKWATMTVEGYGVTDAPVYNGDNRSILSYGVGHLYGSRFPGQGGRVVLSAHVTSIFYSLQDWAVGTRIVLKTAYGTYVYEVEETVIFKYTDETYVEAKDGEDVLVCYTCYPRGSAFRTERFAVICRKIYGYDWR